MDIIDNSDEDTVNSGHSLDSGNISTMNEVVEVLVNIIRVIEYANDIGSHNDEDTVSLLSEPDDNSSALIVSNQRYIDVNDDDNVDVDAMSATEIVIEVLVNMVLAIEHSFEPLAIDTPRIEVIEEADNGEAELAELGVEKPDGDVELVQYAVVEEAKKDETNQRLVRTMSRIQLEKERERLFEEKRLAQEKLIEEDNHIHAIPNLEITGYSAVGQIKETADFNILVIDENDDEEIFAYHNDNDGEKGYDIMVFDDEIQSSCDIMTFEQPIPYDESTFSDAESKYKLSDTGSLGDQGIFSEKALYEGYDDSATNFESTINYIYEDNATNSMSDRNGLSEKGIYDTYEENSIASDGGFGLFSEKGVYEAYDDNMNWDDENTSQLIHNFDELKSLEDESDLLTDSLLRQAGVFFDGYQIEQEFEGSTVYLDNESLDSTRYETINLDELSMYYDDQGKDLNPNISQPETVAIINSSTSVKVFNKRNTTSSHGKKNEAAFGANTKESPVKIKEKEHIHKLGEQLWNGRGEGVYKSTKVEEVKSLRLRKLGEEKNMAKIEITAVAQGKDRSTSPTVEILPDYKYIQMKERLKNISRDIDPTQPSLPSITESSISPKKSQFSKGKPKVNKQSQNQTLPRFDTTFSPSGQTESISKGKLHAESKVEKVQKMYDAYGGTVPSPDNNKETKKDVSIITIDSILNLSTDDVLGIGGIPMGAVDRPSQTPKTLIEKRGDKIELHTVASSFVTNIYKNPLVVSLIVSKKSVPIYNTLVPKSWDPEFHLLTYYSLIGENGEAYRGSKVLDDSSLYPERVFVKVYDPALSVESVASINLKECTTLLYTLCRKYTSSIAPYFPITDISWWSNNLKHIIIIKGKPNGGMSVCISKALIENFCSRMMRGLGPSKHPHEVALSKVPAIVDEKKSGSPKVGKNQSLAQSSTLSMPSTLLKKKLEPWRPASPSSKITPKSPSNSTSPTRARSESPTRARSKSPTQKKGTKVAGNKSKTLDADKFRHAIRIATSIDNDSIDQGFFSRPTFDGNPDCDSGDDGVDTNIVLMQATNQKPETNISNDSLLSPSWRKIDIRERVARGAIVRARAATSVKQSFRTRKLTDIEISLFTSPFAQPFLKPKLDRKTMMEMYNNAMKNEINSDGRATHSSSAHRRREGLMSSFHLGYAT